MVRWASLIVLLAILVVVAFLFMQVMSVFLLPMFLAVLLLVMFRPVHRWFLEQMPTRPRIAAGLTTTAILLIVLVPFAWILTQAALEGTAVVTDWNQRELIERFSKIRKDFGLEMEYGRQLRQIEEGIDQLELLVGPEVTVQGAKWEEQVRHGIEQLVDGLSDLALALTARPEANDWAAASEVQQRLAELRARFPALAEQAADPAVVAPEAAEGAPRQPPGEAAQTAEESADDAADPVLGLSVFDAFVELVEQVDVLLRAAEAEFGGGLLADEIEADGPVPDFDVALVGTRLGYQTFKTRLLGGPLAAWLKEWANPTVEQLSRLRAELLARMESWWAPLALGTTQFLGSVILGAIVMIVSLFFFLADGPSMAQTLMRLSPLDERYERQLMIEFDRVSRAVVIATLLSAFVQGLLAGAGFYLAGLEPVFLLTVLTMLLALIPFVGATAVWLPCAVWIFLYQGRPLAGMLLALYGACVVSVADNVIKPVILHGQSNLHPLLALLSVLGGVRALGPIGIFVGPMVVAFLQALLNILNTELKNMGARGEEEATVLPAVPAGSAASSNGPGSEDSEPGERKGPEAKAAGPSTQVVVQPSSRKRGRPKRR